MTTNGIAVVCGFHPTVPETDRTRIRSLALLRTIMSAPRKMSVTVLYFAAASTATGLTAEEVELPSRTSGDAVVHSKLKNRHECPQHTN